MSSKRRLRRRSCTSKKRYGSVEIAKREAQTISSLLGSFWLPYKCDFCNGYHVGRPKRHPV